MSSGSSCFVVWYGCVELCVVHILTALFTEYDLRWSEELCLVIELISVLQSTTACSIILRTVRVLIILFFMCARCVRSMIFFSANRLAALSLRCLLVSPQHVGIRSEESSIGEHGGHPVRRRC
jgi:hypothetical protein